MEIQYEIKYHQLEEKHWWFRGRRAMVSALIREMKLDREAAILEIGCSGGPLLVALREQGYHNLTGIDISVPAIDLARQRQLPNVSVMSGTDLDFPDQTFDLVVASDVLEHIAEEHQALREWNRVLKPGGRLIVFVPAFSFLWSQHDVVNQHFRRYNGGQLREAVQNSGFKVHRKSYWNFSLFFPATVIRFLQRTLLRQTGRETGDLSTPGQVLNRFLFRLLRLENSVLQFISYPFGVSVFVVARKADEIAPAKNH